MADDGFDPQVKSSKGGFNMKVIIIGIPLFVIQLVGVYFIVAYLMQQKLGHLETNTSHTPDSANVVLEEGEQAEGAEGGTGLAGGDSLVSANIYKIEDMLLNPAGTNGQVIMMISMGLGVKSAENVTYLEEKEVVVRDLIMTSLSQKTLDELRIENRDSLKTELAEKIHKTFPKVKIQNIYFSKFILN